MPHLNIDLDYFGHRKTRRLIGLLGRGSEVLPLKLWAYCGKYHAEDGRLADYTPQEIEAVAEWWGKPGEMLAAMETVQFLHKDGDCYVVHDWLEHQGHIAMFRERGRDLANKRWGKPSNAPRMRTAQDTACGTQCSNGLTDRQSRPPPAGVPPGKPRKKPDTPHQRVVDAYSDAWEARYGHRPSIGGREGSAAKELLRRTDGDDGEACAMLRVFLADGAEKLVNEKHPLPWLNVSFEKYRAKAKGGGGNGSVKRTQIIGEV